MDFSKVENDVWFALSTRSRTSLRKTSYAVGRLNHVTYYYRPRRSLIEGLGLRTGLPASTILNTLYDIRYALLTEMGVKGDIRERVTWERTQSRQLLKDLLK